MTTKYTRFRDIPRFIDSGSYSVDVPWDYLEDHLGRLADGMVLDLNPDFQRAHVWTEEKQLNYIEFVLRGGQSSNSIFMNCSSWMGNFNTPIELVDGKQRLEAARRFLKNEIPAFGSLYSEYTDRIGVMGACFKIHMNQLQTRREVLQWYIDLNEGGVAHTKEEIAKVKALLAKEQP